MKYKIITRTEAIDAKVRGEKVYCRNLNDEVWWDSMWGHFDVGRMLFAIAEPEPPKPREWWISLGDRAHRNKDDAGTMGIHVRAVCSEADEALRREGARRALTWASDLIRKIFNGEVKETPSNQEIERAMDELCKEN